MSAFRELLAGSVRLRFNTFNDYLISSCLNHIPAQFVLRKLFSGTRNITFQILILKIDIYYLNASHKGFQVQTTLNFHFMTILKCSAWIKTSRKMVLLHEHYLKQSICSICSSFGGGERVIFSSLAHR